MLGYCSAFVEPRAHVTLLHSCNLQPTFARMYLSTPVSVSRLDVVDYTATVLSPRTNRQAKVHYFVLLYVEPDIV